MSRTRVLGTICAYVKKVKVLSVSMFNPLRDVGMLGPNAQHPEKLSHPLTVSNKTTQLQSFSLLQCKTGQCLYNKKMGFVVFCLQMCCRHGMAAE